MRHDVEPRPGAAAQGRATTRPSPRRVTSRCSCWSRGAGPGVPSGARARARHRRRARLCVRDGLPARAARARWATRSASAETVYLGAFAFVCVLLHAGCAGPRARSAGRCCCSRVDHPAAGSWACGCRSGSRRRWPGGLRSALYERIGNSWRLLGEADRLAADASDARRTARKCATLASQRPSWAYLFDVRARREAVSPSRSGACAHTCRRRTRRKLEDLASIYTDKLELDAQLVLQACCAAGCGSTCRPPAC